MSVKKTKEQFIKELADDNVEVLGEYISLHHKILVRYKDCGHQEEKKPIKLLRGQRCGQCRGKAISKSKTKSNEQFQKDLISKGITNITLVGEYLGVKHKVTVLNSDCGHVYQAMAGNVLNGVGCPVCHGNKDTQGFIDVINNKYPNEYVVLGKYVNNRTKIQVQHKCGHKWEVIPKDLLRDIRCPKCMMSKGEHYIMNFLTKHNVTFTPQYKFDDCKDKQPLPFDFMIEVKGEIRLIEFDGSHHYKKTMYQNDKVLIHDEMKNRYCHDKGIKLLRIPYWWLRNDRIDRELKAFIDK